MSISRRAHLAGLGAALALMLAGALALSCSHAAKPAATLQAAPAAGPGVCTVTPEPHTAFLPAVYSPPTLSVAYAPEIRDCDGQITTTQWLTANFCAVTWTRPTSNSYLSALWPCCGDCPAVHVAHVVDEDGRPVEGMPVVFWWPDAPWLPAELYNCGRTKGVYGWTNANGDVGFGMGGGAYCWKPAAGPHAVWVGTFSGRSNCLDGIGMNAATNHEHVDSWWVATDEQVRAAAGMDRVYQEGTLVYTETINGRVVPVVVWPAAGWER